MEIYPLFQWSGHRDAVYALNQGVDGMIVSAGGDGTVAVWNPEQPQLPGRALCRLNSGIYALQPPSSDLRAWIIGGTGGELHFIDEAAAAYSQGHSPGNSDGHSPAKSEEHAKWYIGDYLPAHPKDNSHNSSTDSTGFTGLYSEDVGARPPSKGVSTGKAPIHDLRFMGHRLWTAHGDGRLLRWSLESRPPVIEHSIRISSGALRCLMPHPTAPLIASGSSDGKIRLTTETGELVRIFEAHTLSVFSLLFLVGGKYLLSGSRDAHLAVWETESGKLLDRFPAHMGTLNQLVAVPECGWIGSAGRDKEIRLWDAQSLELRRVINREHFPQDAHTHSVNRLLWMHEKRLLLSAGDDRKIRGWQFR
jgi:WD40 repeat protein